MQYPIPKYIHIFYMLRWDIWT